MKVAYRKLFLKDLHNLRHTEVYGRIKDLVFETLPDCERLSEVQGLKPLRQKKNAFRIRLGEYRIGLKMEGDVVEVMRVLPRKDFYRYFP
jgi:mRNA interferase RelE/StbE